MSDTKPNVQESPRILCRINERKNKTKTNTQTYYSQCSENKGEKMFKGARGKDKPYPQKNNSENYIPSEIMQTERVE